MERVFVRVEGVILSTTDFKESDKIATLFTREFGLLSVLLRRAMSEKSEKIAPLAHIEVVFLQKDTEIKACKEYAVLNTNLSLRKSLSHLESACGMVQALSRSQWKEARAPLLYDLFLFLLKKLPESADPLTLLTFFRIKILKHEGLFGLPPDSELSTADQESLISLAQSRTLPPPLPKHLHSYGKKLFEEHFLGAT